MAGALLLYLSIFYFVCSKSETSPDQKELYEEVRFYFTVDALILPLLIPGLRWECLSGPIQTHHENIFAKKKFHHSSKLVYLTEPRAYANRLWFYVNYALCRSGTVQNVLY